jgi:hypothetical protein
MNIKNLKTWVYQLLRDAQLNLIKKMFNNNEIDAKTYKKYLKEI